MVTEGKVLVSKMKTRVKKVYRKCSPTMKRLSIGDERPQAARGARCGVNSKLEKM